MAPVVGNKAVPFLRKSATDGLWENATDFAENRQPALGKSATDFGKISHRLWENEPPTLGQSVTDFGEICHRFCEAPFFWMNRLRFWDKLSLKMKSTGGKLEG